METYHANYILRNQLNPSKRMIRVDVLKVMERTMLPIFEKQCSDFFEK